jgi:hypothetical protein
MPGGLPSRRRVAIQLAAVAGLLAGTRVARAQTATDYLAVPGPIRFDGIMHRLAWTANPSSGYYKQEYLPAGQTLTRFREMILIELIVAGTDPARAVASRVRIVNQRRDYDPTANIAVIKNADKGEFIVDFVLGAPAVRGDALIEWSAYRYVPYKRGVLMVGVSRRAYGEERATFLTNLKIVRPAIIAELAKLQMPAIRLDR